MDSKVQSLETLPATFLRERSVDFGLFWFGLLVWARHTFRFLYAQAKFTMAEKFRVASFLR